MGLLDYVEYGAAWIFKNAKGHDDKLFTKGPAFIDLPEATFEVESPDCGPSGSPMKLEYTQWNEPTARFPELKWTKPSLDVKEYVLICEDPDAPFPTPGTHGLYVKVPEHVIGVTASDFEVVDEGAAEKKLRGPFKLGKNRRGTVYTGPRPPLGHGPHRYLYEVIALKEPLDEKKLSVVPTKDEVAEDIKGKVVGWGVWVGVYEHRKEGFEAWVKTPGS